MTDPTWNCPVGMMWKQLRVAGKLFSVEKQQTQYIQPTRKMLGQLTLYPALIPFKHFDVLSSQNILKSTETSVCSETCCSMTHTCDNFWQPVFHPFSPFLVCFSSFQTFFSVVFFIFIKKKIFLYHCLSSSFVNVSELQWCAVQCSVV